MGTVAMADLLVIVPTRGRPESIAPIVECWNVTGAWEYAELTFVADNDDPTMPAYQEAFNGVELPAREERGPTRLVCANKWRPLVPKLNLAANEWCGGHFAVAFLGDDHRPRTLRWARTMLTALRELGTGVVYGDDLLQRERLCTSWAMTSDIVRALGRMVPAPVEHMYCDNSVMDLAREAGCLRYLPDVVIEHCHPLAGKAEWDPGYARVNRADQFAADEARYLAWRAGPMAQDVATVKALRSVKA
jgi:hypothetical protein